MNYNGQPLAVDKPRYMLEHPSIRRYSFMVPPHHVATLSSDNPIGADNQQET
jgi:hypothetical protein